MIKADLEQKGITAVSGGSGWSVSVIRGIFQNEKYCGDVLQQRSFVNNCISRKHIRNVGQLPMYLTLDHHEGIVSRDTFNAVKAEFARRNAGRVPSRKQAPTGRSCYSAKYALTGRLVCGECGTLYRGCVWSKRGQKKAVWRCASRIDYGTKYCHGSPILHEEPFQAAINSAMSRRAALKEKKSAILEQQESSSAASRRIQDAVNVLNAGFAGIDEWDEGMIRQLADTVKVLSVDRTRVYLRGGMEIEQTIRGQ